MRADKRRYMLNGLLWGAASSACFGAGFAPINWVPLVWLAPPVILIGALRAFGRLAWVRSKALSAGTHGVRTGKRDQVPSSATPSTGEIRPGRMPPIQEQTGGTPVPPNHDSGATASSPGRAPSTDDAPVPPIHLPPPKRAALRFALGVGIAWWPVWALLHLWLIDVSPLGWPLLALIVALYPAAFAWIMARLTIRWGVWATIVAMPIVWTALELLRGEVLFHGYPWYLFAHPTIEEMRASPVAAYGPYVEGMLSLAFPTLAVAMGGLLGRLTKNDWLRAVAIVFVAVAMGFLFAMRLGVPTAQPSGPVLRVAVVQTNVPTDNRTAWTSAQRLADFRRMIELTREAARGKPSLATLQAPSPPPDLIVWPETMVPTFFGLNPAAVEIERNAERGFTVIDDQGVEQQYPSTIFHDALVQLQAEIDIPMIVGGESVEGLVFELNADDSTKEVRWGDRYNSAHLIINGAVQPQRYDKMHLTPFGETLPYLGGVKAVREWMVRNIAAAGMLFDLDSGRVPAVLEVPMRDPATRGLGPNPGGDPGDPPLANRIGPPVVRVATPICFEATMQEVCRALVFDDSGARRADVMINLTNDGWFGRFDANRLHHLQAARWRCLQLNTPMVRAANTGISVGIDARGRIIEPGIGPRVDGVVFVDVPIPNAGDTVPARWSQQVQWAIGIAGVIAMGLALIPGGRNAASKKPARASQ